MRVSRQALCSVKRLLARHDEIPRKRSNHDCARGDVISTPLSKVTTIYSSGGIHPNPELHNKPKHTPPWLGAHPPRFRMQGNVCAAFRQPSHTLPTCLSSCSTGFLIIILARLALLLFLLAVRDPIGVVATGQGTGHVCLDAVLALKAAAGLVPSVSPCTRQLSSLVHAPGALVCVGARVSQLLGWTMGSVEVEAEVG